MLVGGSLSQWDGIDPTNATITEPRFEACLSILEGWDSQYGFVHTVYVRVYVNTVNICQSIYIYILIGGHTCYIPPYHHYIHIIPYHCPIKPSSGWRFRTPRDNHHKWWLGSSSEIRLNKHITTNQIIIGIVALCTPGLSGWNSMNAV